MEYTHSSFQENPQKFNRESGGVGMSIEKSTLRASGNLSSQSLFHGRRHEAGEWATEMGDLSNELGA